MKKVILLLSLVVLCLTGVKASSVTWVAADQGYENAQVVDAAPIALNNDVTLTLDQNGASNGPKYYNTGTAIRMYGGNTATIATKNGEAITKVVFTCGSSNVLKPDAVSAGEFTTDGNVVTWTGSIASFSFAQAGTTGHARLESITVTYGGTPEEEPETPQEPEVPADPVVTSITAANSLSNNQTFVFDAPLTVVYVGGAYNYVYDGANYGLVYKYDLGLKAGDVIPAGWTGKLSIYNALPELIPTSEIVATGEAATLPNPTEVTSETAANYLNVANVFAYLKLTNVTFESATPAKGAFTGAMGDVEASLYNSCGLPSVEAGTYNVVGFVSVYKTDYQLVPVAYELVSDTPVTPEDPSEGIAETVTWVAADQGYENAQSVDVASIALNDVVSLTFSAGSNKNNPKYYTSGAAIRLYGGNTATLATKNGKAITQVVITCGSSNVLNPDAVSAGEFTIEGNVAIWRGNVTSFSFAQAGTTGHARIESITVTYGGAPGEEPEIPADPVVTTILAANGLSNNQTFVYDAPLTVVNAIGAYNYVYDGTSYGLIYKTDLGLSAGDVISGGWRGKLSVYNGLPELVPTSELVVTGDVATLPTPTMVNSHNAATYLNADNVLAYLRLTEVNFASGTPEAGAFTGAMADVEVSFYNSCRIAAVEAGTYDVTGFVSVYKTDYQFVPFAYEASSVAPKYLYAVGNFQGWDIAEPVMLEYDPATGVYTLQATDLAALKISTVETDDWSDFNDGAIIPVAELQDGVATAFTIGGDTDIIMPFVGEWKITVDLSTMLITAESTGGPVIPDVDIYLRGNMNGWSADEAWKFKPSETTKYIYILENVQISANDDFKIASVDWGSVNYGGCVNMELNTYYPLVYSGYNCTLAQDFEGNVIYSAADHTIAFFSTSAILDVESASTPAVFYNLQGVKVNNPEAGNIYIRIADGKATKVIVK